MTEAQIGDKVRISYEGVVNDTGLSYLELDNGEVGVTLDNFEVEILEKAKPKDDPRNDLVGTIRQGNRGPWVKVWHSEWRLANGIQSDVLGDYVFVPDWHPVIGVVPGSPAAKAQEAREAAPALTKFTVGQQVLGTHVSTTRKGKVLGYNNCELCPQVPGSEFNVYDTNEGYIHFNGARLQHWAQAD